MNLGKNILLIDPKLAPGSLNTIALLDFWVSVTENM